MKHKNLIALFLILLAVLGGTAELCGWLLPTLSWPFSVSRDLSFLRLPASYCPAMAVNGSFHYFGWLCMALLALLGFYLLLRRSGSLRLPPEYVKRFRRFRSLKRGYYSFLLLIGLLLLASLDQCLVGKRALAVEYAGKLYFPALTRDVLPGSVFGLKGAEAHAETDYRKLKKEVGQPGGPTAVLMPLIPYDPTMDAVPFPTEELPLRAACLYAPDGKSLYNGQACRLYPDGNLHLRLRYRNGLPDGQAQGWAPDRRQVYSAVYKEGELLEQKYRGQGAVEDFLALTPSDKLSRIYYHPAPPLCGDHLLGTNSQGSDIAAYLYGGLQVNIKAALFYLPLVYSIGLGMGMLMGYFGGKFDMLTQRFIEIMSQLPFLFVVMILSDLAPMEFRGMFLILALLSLFAWMPMTYLVRTSTMKEKTRDYVAAARVMGAGPLYIMRYHILPNLMGIIVTLLPFSVAGLVLCLASLDYMGFGLPETYASWGRLLNDGLSKLSSPWVVSSAFFALVLTLLLVTFVGEAVREAFDPRRDTHYE